MMMMSIHKLPAGHGVHVLLEGWPVLLEYVPLTHAVHWVDPSASENVPTPHTSHVLALVAPMACEYVPLGHGKHADNRYCAVCSLYVPAGHLVHMLPSVMPGTVEYVPLGHACKKCSRQKTKNLGKCMFKNTDLARLAAAGALLRRVVACPALGAVLGKRDDVGGRVRAGRALVALVLVH